MKPIRIQRSRKEKQVSPNGLTIKAVSRPSVWGNPFKIKEGEIFILTEINGKWIFLCNGDIDLVMNLYRIIVTNKIGKLKMECKISMFKYLSYWADHFSKLNVNDLRGMNLSCWCKKINMELCHADILLELANQ